MPVLPKAPSPQEFAKTWTRGFARAVREAAGRDGRLSRSEGAQIAARTDGLSVYADNVENFFEETGQKSVAVEKLIGTGHNYAEAQAERVGGDNQRVSLLEARMLPADLRTEFFALRGKSDPLPHAPELEARLAAVTDSGIGVYFADRAEPSVREISARDLAGVERHLRGNDDAFDEVAITAGSTGATAVHDVLVGMSEFADAALGPASRDEGHAALAALRKDVSAFGDDAQLLHVVRSAGGEDSFSDVMVLGLRTGKPLLLEVPE
jgi:hypothetical protein